MVTTIPPGADLSFCVRTASELKSNPAVRIPKTKSAIVVVKRDRVAFPVFLCRAWLDRKLALMVASAIVRSRVSRLGRPRRGRSFWGPLVSKRLVNFAPLDDEAVVDGGLNALSTA